MHSFTFNGEQKSYVKVMERDRPYWMPIERGIETETRGIGGYARQGFTSGALEIPVKIRIEAYYQEQLRSRSEDLAEWLVTNEPKPLVFDDEPNRTYYAMIKGDAVPDKEIGLFSILQITFVCPDPHSYGPDNHVNINGDTALAVNDGNTDSYPVFDLTVDHTTSLISIKNYGNLDPEGTPRKIVLGTDGEADQPEVNTKKLVMHDSMQSTSGWTKATNVDSGTVSGEMTTDKDGFYAKKWGDEDNKADDGYGSDNNLGDWVGPSLEKALPSPINNSFTVEALVENQNDKNPDGSPVGVQHTGLMEIYFRDVNGNKIAKIQFGDSFGNKVENRAAFEKGRVDAIGEKRFSLQRSGWNDFDGKLYVKRDTDDFIVEVSVDNGSGEYIKRKSLRDRPIAETGTQDRNPLHTIQVAIRKYNGSMRMYNRIKNIKVYDSVGEFDDLLENDKTPIQFNSGDRLKIDTKNSKILLNGDPRPDLLHLDSDFFSLVQGLNELKLSGNVSGSMTYPDRYL